MVTFMCCAPFWPHSSSETRNVRPSPRGHMMTRYFFLTSVSHARVSTMMGLGSDFERSTWNAPVFLMACKQLPHTSVSTPSPSTADSCADAGAESGTTATAPPAIILRFSFTAVSRVRGILFTWMLCSVPLGCRARRLRG